MKAATVLSVVILGVCLAILYIVRRDTGGEVILAPMSIDFEDVPMGAFDLGLMPPDMVVGYDPGE